MKILFITPQVGRKANGQYVRTWQMEPLTIATLYALTPSDIEVEYVDERLGETPDYEKKYDLVAITVETYTAKRAYEIALEYQRRNIKVILGGYHVTLIPDEARRFADAICIRTAESQWTQIITDLRRNELRHTYNTPPLVQYEFVIPDRTIFGSRKYFKLSCVETGRGCPLSCNFCSIAAGSNSTYRARAIDSVLKDITQTGGNSIFFVEDNFVGNIRHAKELLTAIKGLGIRWVGQGTLTMARDEQLLALMRDSGCIGVLIGFESLDAATLQLMNKNVNIKMGSFKDHIKRLHEFGIALYGTFIFGYDSQTYSDILETAKRATEFGIFMAAFNHLMPFPGTPLYQTLKQEGRLTHETWWLDPNFRFGQVPFNPKHMTPEELRQGCLEARKKFYGWHSIIHRGIHNISGNCGYLSKAGAYLWINTMLRKEIDQKDGLPLGNEPAIPQPLIKNEIAL